MATRMQQRRGTAQQWTDADPILAAGEIGFETDTNQFKIGDGVNAWSDLSYFKNLEDLGGSLDDYVPVSTKGQANGVAELDNTGKIPSSQIPALVGLDTEIASAVSAAVSDLVDGAPAALNTLNEIAEVIGDSGNIVGSLITNIGGLNDAIGLHASDTTNVHGIPDTANLATQTQAMGYANAAEDNAISASNTYTDEQITLSATNTLESASNDAASQISTHSTDTTNVHGIANTADLATQDYVDDAVSTSATTTLSTASDAASTALSTHAADTTAVHGISDTANLVYTADSRLSDERTPSAGSVTAAKIATDAVETAKIKDLNVTTGKIADSAITSAKIADATIVDGDISSSAAIAQSKISGLTSDLAAKLASATAASTYAPIANPTFTGTVAGVTKSMVGLGNVDNTTDANKPVSTATQTALDAKLALAGGTMTGALTLSGAPTSDLHAATKLYVDGVASGINFHAPVKAATSTNISTTYSNGTNGYGATLTADANGAMGTVDGQTMSVGDRVLVKSQTDAKQNGIYAITSLGGASSKWVMTRATDDDNNPNGEMAAGDFCFVTSGTLSANTGYILSGTGTLAIGTDNINYVQFNAAQAIIAGSGLTKTGGTLSIEAGAITSSMILDGTIVDADINASAAIAQSKISGLTSALSAKAPLDAPTFTNLVTVSASGVAFTDGTQTKAGVPSITTIATAIASSATLAAGEQDKFVPLTGAVQITLPATGYSTGQSIDFYQASGTGASFASTNGVVGTPGLKFRTTYSVVTAMKISGGWLVFGDLSA